MSKINAVIVQVLLSTAVFVSQAQSPKQFYSIESPTSAQLKGSIESPVSLNVGKVGVSIPLYTLQQSDIEVPVVLIHNSNGVKLDMHPGWVGLNWNLSAGGVVTRNVKGIPDETFWRHNYVLTADGDNSGTRTYYFGYFLNSNNEVTNWSAPERITELAKSGMEPGTSYWSEAEPDEFVFNCGGYSGKFYVDHNGYVRVQSQPEIKVELEIFVDVPLYDASRPLNASDPYSYTTRSTISYDGSLIYSYNRFLRSILWGFKVTTPDGFQYEFGMWGKPYDPNDAFDNVEFTADMFDQFLLNEVFTTWYLKKIIAPNNEMVEFFYERGDPIMQMGQGFSFYKAGGSASPKGFLGFLFGNVSSYTSQANAELTGKFIRPTYLKKIESKTATLEFITSTTSELTYDYEVIADEILYRSQYYDPNHIAPLFAPRGMLGVTYANPDPNWYTPGWIYWGSNKYTIIRYDGWMEDLAFNKLKWRKLDKVLVKSKVNNELIQEWQFSYNDGFNERLQLMSLRQKGRDGSLLPAYLFEYDKSKDLPKYNSLLTDHWGYYNGTEAPINVNNATILQAYKDKREPVEEFLYAGSLVKVTTPTGGVKEFTYEPNRYKSIVKRNTQSGEFYITPLSVTKMGGGLRVKEVKEKFGAGNSEVVTMYEYGDGLLMGDIQYYWPSYKGRLLNGNEYASTRFVTESLLPVSENPGGGDVTYEVVTERRVGNGKTIQKFTGFVASPDIQGTTIDIDKSPYSPFTSKSMERGLLKEVTQYDESGAIISSEEFEYVANPGFANDFIRSVNSRGISLFGSGEVNVIEGTAYKHYLYPFQNVKRTSRLRDRSTGLFLTTSMDFVYDNDASSYNDNQLKEVKRTNSDGTASLTRFTHPLDYQVNDGVSELTGINSLKLKNMWGAKITEEVSVKRPGASQYLLKSYTLNTYRRLLVDFPVVAATYTLNIKEPTTQQNTSINQSSFILDSRLIKDISYTQYDSDGKLLEFVTSDGKPIALLYGYGNQRLIAKVENATYQSIVNALGQTAIDQLKGIDPGTDEQVRAKLYELRGAIPHARITSYTHHPWIGVTSIADVNGVTTFYEYDSFNRLKLVKDNNENILKIFDYKYKLR